MVNFVFKLCEIHPLCLKFWASKDKRWVIGDIKIAPFCYTHLALKLKLVQKTISLREYWLLLCVYLCWEKIHGLKSQIHCVWIPAPPLSSYLMGKLLSLPGCKILYVKVETKIPRFQGVIWSNDYKVSTAE